MYSVHSPQCTAAVLIAFINYLRLLIKMSILKSVFSNCIKCNTTTYIYLLYGANENQMYDRDRTSQNKKKM